MDPSKPKTVQEFKKLIADRLKVFRSQKSQADTTTEPAASESAPPQSNNTSTIGDLTKGSQVHAGQKRGAEDPLPPKPNVKIPRPSDESYEVDRSLYPTTPCKRQQCAFGVLDSTTPWMVGNPDLASVPWSVFIMIDAGQQSGMPFLKLILQADDHSPSNKKSASMIWYAHAWTHDCALPMEALRHEMFHEWFERTRDDIRNLPAIADADAAKRRDVLAYVECDLQKPVFSDFKDPSVWETIPTAVSNAFHGLLIKKQLVSFVVFVKDQGFRDHLLPALSRHVEEGVGMFSQYKDPNTQEYNLYNIKDVATVQQVRGGMYVKGDGSIFSMPKLYSFPFPFQFKVLAALTPIREAQYDASKGKPPRYQAELTAVNHFCDNTSDHAPCMNFHQLLMTGGQSNCSDNNVLDLCGTDLKNIKFFEAAIEAARTLLNDDKQVCFIKRLRDIRSNTLALSGPAGSGKSRLLGFVAALLALLGHKVLVCAAGDLLVEKLEQDVLSFGASLTSMPSDWIPERRVLQVMSGTRRSEQGYEIALKTQQFSELDVLLINSRNHGFKEMAKDYFKPTVILVDDAQQIYHASLFLTLTQFTSWQALILAGDHAQIGPRIRARKASEVAANSQITAMELLHVAKTNVFTLDTQYRMIAQIADFPGKQFYSGLRSCGTADQITNQKFRNVSRQYVKNRVTGSGYFFLNVPKALSRITPGTGTLSNLCNAKAIQVLVTKLLEEGIPPDEVTILCFYQAQVKGISDTFQKSTDNRLKAIDIHTVDTFYGQEASITIVDFVEANDIDLDTFYYLRQNPARRVPGLGNDKISASYYTRDHGRIATALTRANNGLVVVGQISLFVGQVWSGLEEYSNTLFSMAEDAVRRKLVYTAEDIVDEELEAAGSGGITDIQAMVAVVEERKQHQRVVAEMLRRGRKTLDGKGAG
ncbi:MAG: hypothetical protein Q9226_006098 [Calogaya cf. arnoldii]